MSRGITYHGEPDLLYVRCPYVGAPVELCVQDKDGALHVYNVSNPRQLKLAKDLLDYFSDARPEQVNA